MKLLKSLYWPIVNKGMIAYCRVILKPLGGKNSVAVLVVKWLNISAVDSVILFFSIFFLFFFWQMLVTGGGDICRAVLFLWVSKCRSVLRTILDLGFRVFSLFS